MIYSTKRYETKMITFWIDIGHNLAWTSGKWCTVYPKKYAHGLCFAVLCCGYTLTDFPIFIRLTSLALWQSNNCLSASKATLMNMDTYFMWIHYERLHNHNKAKHNKTVCIFLGIYCMAVCNWPMYLLCLICLTQPYSANWCSRVFTFCVFTMCWFETLWSWSCTR